MSMESDEDYFEPTPRGVAQGSVRIANERAVLTLITARPGSSNADIARRTGLGPQTTSRIVSELEARGLVLRGQVLRGRRGQPATPLFLDPDGAYSIGVEIGWRHREIVLNTVSGQVLASTRRSYDYPDARTIFTEIATEIAALRAGLTPRQRARLVAIGVASPTLIGRSIARLGAPPEQQGLWCGLDIAARLTHDTGLPAEWFNDGSAACWAEIIAHPRPRPAGFAYFQVGTFIAAGIVAGDSLWLGPTGNAADLGSIMVTDADGQPTFVHLVASIMALQRRLEQAGVPVPTGAPQHWDWAALEPHASLWLDDAGRALAKAIVTTRALIELDKAIVDGVMPRPVVERLLERVQHHLAGLPEPSLGKPSVAIGHLGASAAAMGAAQLPLFRRYFSPARSDFDPDHAEPRPAHA